MKRIGIFSFYDKDGIVDSYIEYLLQELTTVVNRLIIVVNGMVNDCGRGLFTKYTDELVVRQNTGFDAGAYADIILNYLPQEKLQEYDELVLCNDTFYGPFVSMQEIFAEMDEKQCDFWGINIVDRGLLNYLQSYFLVYKKNVLINNTFIGYLKNNIDVNETDIVNVYGKFEVGLFYELIRAGYVYDFYRNTKLHDLYSNPYVSMSIYNLPILKKKSMELRYNTRMEILSCLSWIQKNTSYKMVYILDNAKRQYSLDIEEMEIKKCQEINHEKEDRISKAMITENELIEWIGDSPFYIYGAGVIARMLYLVYMQEKSSFLGFVVSNDIKIKEQSLFGYPVLRIKDIEETVKIVVGVSNKYLLEVEENLKDYKEFLCLWEREL